MWVTKIHIAVVLPSSHVAETWVVSRGAGTCARCRHFKHTLKPTQHNVHSYFSSSRTPTNSVHFGCFATFRHTNTNSVFRMVWFRLLQLTECFYLFIAYVLLSFQLWLALAKRVFYQATEMLQEQCFRCSV